MRFCCNDCIVDSASPVRHWHGNGLTFTIGCSLFVLEAVLELQICWWGAACASRASEKKLKSSSFGCDCQDHVYRKLVLAENHDLASRKFSVIFSFCCKFAILAMPCKLPQYFVSFRNVFAAARNFQQIRLKVGYFYHSFSAADKQGKCNYTVSQKTSHLKLSLTLSNLNRLSNFLHSWKAYEILL